MVDFPGEKKKQRKEMIAVRRRERMLRRGVDLEQLNLVIGNLDYKLIRMINFLYLLW